MNPSAGRATRSSRTTLPLGPVSVSSTGTPATGPQSSRLTMIPRWPSSPGR